MNFLISHSQMHIPHHETREKLSHFSQPPAKLSVAQPAPSRGEDVQAGANSFTQGEISVRIVSDCSLYNQ